MKSDSFGADLVDRHLATNSVQICLGVTGTGEGVRDASLPADADLAFAHTSWWMTGLDGIRVPAS